MGNVVTFDVFLWVVAVQLAFIGVNWIYTYRSVQILHSRVSNRGIELGAYKLEVSEKYASVTHLNEVESRINTNVEAMSVDIKELTKAIHELTGFVRDSREVA